MIRILLFLLFLSTAPPCLAGEAVEWYDGKAAVSYCFHGKPTPVVATALEMFADDMEQVTNQRAISLRHNATIQVYQMNQVSSLDDDLKDGQKWTGQIKGKKDAFTIYVHKGRIIVAGSDSRGVAYGILELSRLAGVSPWTWWADAMPARKEKLTIDDGYHTVQSPSVEYRGIFLNDEDWSLQPWSWRHYDPAKPGYISAKTYKKIFQLLMRLRANAIWPGMHGMTTAFYLVRGAKEVADSCGIVIGTSHCEPLMRNNVGEWKSAVRGDYNYVTNKKGVQDYWIERLKECGRYENFYTIGMRGVHDSGMEGVGKDLDEQTRWLQTVIDDQRGLLRKYVSKDVEKLPQQFVPYKEVLQIMENGLRLPDDVTITWCDDNYGYMTRLSDSLQQKRKGGGGIYYHLSYWGRPHDYMWLSTTQPGLIYNEMKQAYDHNVRKLWIVNVHDMKTPAYDLELFLDMAWNINSVNGSTLWQHQENWLAREFSPSVAKRLMPAMKEFWRLTAIRKPEFMGWSQVEVDKKTYRRGMTPVRDTEFSEKAFGGELDRFLSDWRKVATTVKKIGKEMPSDRCDAYFSHVLYPVLGAQAMSVKMLEAQRARRIANGTYDAARWQRDSILYKAVAKSQAAYQKIRSLTKYWNDSLAGGKWKYSMCDNPRDLYVFDAPQLPVALTSDEVKTWASLPDNEPRALEESVGDSCIVRNACQYSVADSGIENIQSLGHSMMAVAVPKGKSLSYDFDSAIDGQAVLRVAVIPTQPNDKGDIRFSVTLDGGKIGECSFKEGFRTEGWKKNVLRGQAIRTIPVTLSKGRHNLKIEAMDDHVVVDQWMIDFVPDRQFYVFPVGEGIKG